MRLPGRAFWILWLTGLVLTGCRRTEPPPVDAGAPRSDVLVRIGEGEVRQGDLDRELLRRGSRGTGDFNEALEELVQRQRMVAEARRLGLHEDPGVRRALDAVLIARLKERELEPRFTEGSNTPPTTGAVSPSVGPLAGIPQSRFAWLRLQCGRRAPESRRVALRERMELARERALLLGPEVVGFGGLSVEFSDDDASRAAGGDLGWFPASGEGIPGEPAVRQAAQALSVTGAISPVVETPGGFYLIRLLGQRMQQPGATAGAVALEAHRAELERRRLIEAGYAGELRARFAGQFATNAIEAARAAWGQRQQGPDPGVPVGPAGGGR